MYGEHVSGVGPKAAGIVVRPGFQALACSVVCVLSLFLASAAGAPSPRQDWVQFRDNARLTGVAPPGLAPTLSLRWTLETGAAI